MCSLGIRTVLLTVGFASLGICPPSLSAAWRVQLYTVLAIVVATLAMHKMDQISQFHAFAAYNMAALAWSTLTNCVCVENCIGRGPITVTVEIPFIKQRGSFKLQTHCPIMAFIIQKPHWGLGLISLVPVRRICPTPAKM